MGRVGSGRKISCFRGSGRVSGLVGRVGSEVWLELVGRVGSGHQVDGSGRVIKK